MTHTLRHETIKALSHHIAVGLFHFNHVEDCDAAEALIKREITEWLEDNPCQTVETSRFDTQGVGFVVSG